MLRKELFKMSISVLAFVIIINFIFVFINTFININVFVNIILVIFNIFMILIASALFYIGLWKENKNARIK